MNTESAVGWKESLPRSSSFLGMDPALLLYLAQCPSRPRGNGNCVPGLGYPMCPLRAG